MQKSIFTTIILTIVTCLIYAVTAGIANDYGMLLGALVESTNLSYASVSLIIAFGQMCYGLFQPLFGLLAQKKGNRAALFSGIVLMLIGLLLLPYCRAAWQLVICIGLLLPAGTGSVSYGLLIGCIAPKIAPGTLALVSGIVNASCGIGNALLLPATQYLIAAFGLGGAMFMLAVPTAVLIPLCLFISSKKGTELKEQVENAAAQSDVSVLAQFREAFSSRTYRLLMLAFFTCGFHMTLIYSHLPSELNFAGVSADVSALAFSVYGIVTIAGSVMSGWFCDRLPMQKVAGTFFGSRVFIVLAFLLLPKNAFIVVAIAALLGLTGAATVPPVSSIIGKCFGAARLATLFGFVYFIHQVGAFFGAWLGGECYELFGGYTAIWVTDMIFCALASFACFAIRDKRI